MRCLSLIVCLSLCSCASGPEILNPAPYDPTFPGPDVANPPLPPLTNYTDFSGAAQQMYVLSYKYSAVRNTILVQEPFFDIPIIGLAIATVANPIFHGAAAATTALGLTSTAAAGLRVYYSPVAKANAYNAAAQSLGCGSSVAIQMNNVQTAINAPATPQILDQADLMAQLNQNIADAGGMLAANSSGVSGNKLLSARDQAVKTRDDLGAAYATLASGPSQLSIFANGIIGNTTNKILGVSQNSDAVVAAIRNTTPSPTTPSTPVSPSKPAAAAPSSPATTNSVAISDVLQAADNNTISSKTALTKIQDIIASAPALAPSADQIAQNLLSETTQAQSMSKQINDAWSGLTKCALPST